MSNIYVPGLGDKYQTKEMVDRLMEVERAKLTKLEKQEEVIRIEKNAWFKVNNVLSSLNTASKTLYGFRSPFSDKVVESSHPHIVTATATRSAVPDLKQIQVKKIAQAIRIASDNIKSDYHVKEGMYKINLGEQELKLYYSGGSIQDFVKQINSKFKGTLKASVTRSTPETVKVIFESLKTGKQNQISFTGDLMKELALDTGMAKQGITFDKHIDFQAGRAVNNKKEIQNSEITLKPEKQIRIPFPITVKPSYILELDMAVTDVGKSEEQEKKPPTGPNLKSLGEVEVGGFIVKGEKSISALPEIKQKQPETVKKEPVISDKYISFYKQASRTVELPELEVEENIKKIRIPLSDFFSDGDEFDHIEFHNQNTDKILHIKDAHIFDPQSLGGIQLKNVLRQPEDAKFTVDGIEITRPTNEVSDVIDSITLNLRNPGNTEVNLQIDYDFERMKNTILNMIEKYNISMDELNIITNSRVGEEKGIFAGDITLNSIKNRLREITMNSYATGDYQGINMLSQIGISTNESWRNSGMDTGKLKGYLEVNEEKLLTALRQYPEAVKDLFGYDADNDLVVDSGIGFLLNKYLDAYTKRQTGIIAGRISLADRRIAENEKKIVDYNAYLEKKEKELKEKFMKMESAVESMNQNAKKLDNFNQQNR